MRAVRRRDTAPEVRLRSRLHGRGLRFRVDVAPLGGSRRRADIAFTRARLAVFVDGCFWHRCPNTERCRGATATSGGRSSTGTWRIATKKPTRSSLNAAGRSFVFRERGDVGPAADRIEAIYSGRIESVERPANSA